MAIQVRNIHRLDYFVKEVDTNITLYEEKLNILKDQATQHIHKLQQQVQRGQIDHNHFNYKKQEAINTVKYAKGLLDDKKVQLKKERDTAHKQLNILKESLEMKKKEQFAERFQFMVIKQHGNALWYKKTTTVNIVVPPNQLGGVFSNSTIYFKPHPKQNRWIVVLDEHEVLHRKNYSGARFPDNATNLDSIRSELDEI